MTPVFGRASMCHMAKSKVLHIRVEPELADELADRATDDERTISEYCRRLLRSAVETAA